jgi:hypothetical protein
VNGFREIQKLKVASLLASQAIKHKNKKNDAHLAEVLKNGLERLEDELERIKRKVGMGHGVRVEWLPNEVKFIKERQLEEEVIKDTIFIYADDLDRALELVRHGFTEWLLNQHSKPYRMMINKLIELFEEMHYEQKERIADAIAELLYSEGET